MRHLPIALLLAALALPATAHADSISFIKAGDVWLAEPDGSGAVQLTSQGTYKAASQGDDGTLVAISGSRIYRRDHATGAVINQINTPLGLGWFGPWEPAISPNGTKIAYEIRDFNGYPAVAYSNTDGSIQSRPLHTGWTWPAWIDNTWLLHSEKPNALAKDTIVRAVGSTNNEGTPWFSHPGRTPLADVDIRGNLFAGITDDAIMTVFRFSGEAWNFAVEGFSSTRCRPASSPGPRSRPTLARSCGARATASGAVRCPTSAAAALVPPSGRLIIPGAVNPDWSPAGVPACPFRRRPRRPRRRPRPCPSRRARKPMTISVAKQSLKTALKKGMTVKLANTAAKTKVTARYKKQTVASGSGTSTVKLTFTRKAARDLKRKKRVTLTLKAGTVTKTLTLK